MAKVYDALRRAEEERRKLSDPGAAHRPPEWEPDSASETPLLPTARAPLLRRLLPKRSAKSAPQTSTAPIRCSAESYLSEQFRALRVDRCAETPAQNRTLR